MPYWFEPTSVSVEVGGRTMTIETGKIAKQAAGAALVSFGDTVVLVTAVHSKPRPVVQSRYKRPCIFASRVLTQLKIVHGHE